MTTKITTISGEGTTISFKNPIKEIVLDYGYVIQTIHFGKLANWPHTKVIDVSEEVKP